MDTVKLLPEVTCIWDPNSRWFSSPKDILVIQSDMDMVMCGNNTQASRRRFIAASGAAAVGTFGLNTVPTLAEAQNSSEDRQQSLQVLCYNIHSGRGTDGAYDLRRVADVIESVDPDIAALQEVDKNYHVPWRESSRSDLDDQPELLTTWLDMNSEYFVYIDYAGTEDHFDNYEDGKGQYGDLILSKYPIVTSTFYPYDAQDNDGEYYHFGISETKINANGAHFWFYSVHPTAQSVALNKEQQEQLIETTRERELPRILGGDFNARYGIGDNPRQITYEILNDAYVDILRQTGDDEYTFPAPGRDGNKRRLDYIFASDGVGIGDGNVISHDPPSPSDHRPLVADLMLTRGENGQGSP